LRGGSGHLGGGLFALIQPPESCEGRSRHQTRHRQSHQGLFLDVFVVRQVVFRRHSGLLNMPADGADRLYFRGVSWYLARAFLPRCNPFPCNCIPEKFNVAIQRTLSIIKPDAVAKDVIGKIYSRFETNGLKIVAAKMAWLSRTEAEGFYAVHKERPFFKDLVDFMTSGPVMIQVLEGENAIAKNRELMGATDPKKAEPGTIRADFAQSIDANAVHGSDAPETAAVEIAYFFPACEIFSR
jgi:nucleoside-diphosphate kinase